MVHEIAGQISGSGISVGIVVARFNSVVVEQLLSGALDTLTRLGVAEEAITVVRVPGAWELSGTIHRLQSRRPCDGYLALGAVIRGETPHFDMVAGQVSRGLFHLTTELDVPVVFGVLTTDTVGQAQDRAGSKSGNKGSDGALSLLEMISVYRQL